MPNYTTNFNLEKPLASDYYDVEVQNSNMDTIDTELQSLKIEKANQTDLDTTSQNVSQNTSDIASLTTQTAGLETNKVDKVSGRGLSTNDYTDAEKSKLAGVEAGANKYQHPSTHAASMIVQDGTHRFVTDSEKVIWNGKLNASSYTAADVLAKVKSVDGSGSGLDADLLDGVQLSEASTGNTVVKRNSSGDINARLFRSEYDDINATVNYIMTQVDTASNNYIRPSTPAQVKSALGVTKSDVGLGYVQNYGVATLAEAKAGTANYRYMTPLRTKEALTSVDALIYASLL